MAFDRPTSAARIWIATLLVGVAIAFPCTLRGQTAGADDGSALLGVTIGAAGVYSGAALGLAAGLVPCSYMRDGTTCARVSAVVGGVLGGAAGSVIGVQSEDLSRDRLRGMAYGAGIGAAAGWALQGVVRHYGWVDAGAGALLGGAIGAAPKGAGLGFAAGAVAGTALWAIFPQVQVSDAVGLSLLGLAAGGIGEWIYHATQAGSIEAGTTSLPVFTIRF